MKKLLIAFLSAMALASCVDSLDDYNIDQKRASKVPPETLFTNALKELSDALTTPNVNNNNFRLYTQQWATTTYLQEPRYDLTSRTIPQSLWQSMYKDVLADLNESKRLLNADALMIDTDKKTRIAQIEIIEVYAWSVLVNTFGNVPYSQAFNFQNPVPVYDDAAGIYADILTRLDAALASLATPGTAFQTGDLLYSGDVAKWIKFGNSLKLKLAMVIADVNAGKAKTLSEQAAPNVFASNADNARFPYLAVPPNNNPLSANLNPTFSTRQDYVIASAITNEMNARNDPRRPFYFTAVNGQYVGGNYGFANAYADFSHVSDKVIAPAFEALLLDYSEVQFLLAEAVERGFSVGGTAAEHYNAAVEASIVYWGGTPADAATYLAQPSVAYATAPGTYKQKIGTQKWIALYNRGFDAWIEWRRFDFPVLLPPSGGTAPAGLQIPVRLIYPINEQTLNGVNREAAAAAIGGDLATTKLFWDVF
ncbi:SusD/RagB family nutrient-binding outer membrane lipoprotein [Fulvivirgaceae bacterium PWU4]|uniref:SusD/RagB family nutrient-binding outer membrane lipoprotein n=1 Tax=Chryseosolibacter histidini TaxID=2782349 RepID=A0AAP2DRA0_9BACT|nr:SusD/RagB family nutrient-binding outer membrane lipoprotein [Chryseosolibacter histidini]MBT1698879.1 SusD/RagB family nutrient-binding outer membrane lipoprotein [Chryseosolibacter histidini]